MDSDKRTLEEVEGLPLGLSYGNMQAGIGKKLAQDSSSCELYQLVRL